MAITSDFLPRLYNLDSGIIAGIAIFSIVFAYGLDPVTGAAPTGFDEQMDCIFAFISHTLAQAGGSAHRYRSSSLLSRRQKEYRVDDGRASRYLDKVRPAHTTVIVELPVDVAKIEIEVTALRRTT